MGCRQIRSQKFTCLTGQVSAMITPGSVISLVRKRAEAPAETLAIKDNSESTTTLNSYKIAKRFPSLRGYC